MLKFKKKREMRYDPEKFYRTEYNGIEVLIEREKEINTQTHIPGKGPIESHRFFILDFNKKAY